MIATDIHVVNVTRMRATPWNAAQWVSGFLSLFLWLMAATGPTDDTTERRALFLCGLLAIEAFATASATLLLMAPQNHVFYRVANWLAIVLSMMAWFPGVAASWWMGMGPIDAIILLASVVAAVSWFALAALSNRS